MLKLGLPLCEGNTVSQGCEIRLRHKAEKPMRAAFFEHGISSPL